MRDGRKRKENKKKAKHTIVMSLSSVIQSCATEASSRTKKGPLTSTLICHWQRTPKAYSSETPKSASGSRVQVSNQMDTVRSLFLNTMTLLGSLPYTQKSFPSGVDAQTDLELSTKHLRCDVRVLAKQKHRHWWMTALSLWKAGTLQLKPSCGPS